MIQRIQTFWLLLTTVAAFLTIKLSFFSGNIIAADQSKKFEHLNAESNILLLLLTITTGTVAFIAIFLYKNRKLQLRIVFAGIIVSICILFIYYSQAKKFMEGSMDITALIVLAIPILFVLAARGIYKDEKLVKSLDRLR